MSARAASHAGSWYTSSSSQLDGQLSSWLEAAQPEPPLRFPVKGCKAIIGPHAGYSYSGPAAAWAYKTIDTTGIKRVFVLGPSHHVYLDGCAVTQCSLYETPVGELPIDRETTDELFKTGKFKKMDLETDEDEHSIEMHLPYVRKIFEGCDIKIVPVLVGSLSTSKEKEYGELLAPYLADPATFFVVSSDFCHWGTRFSYTYYEPSDAAPGISLSRSRKPDPQQPIYKSIEQVDQRGMQLISFGDVGQSIVASQSGKAAREAHDEFANYLKQTRNTICGRHPIGVLLGAVSSLQERDEQWQKASLAWTRYEQSSQCRELSDSSVSYASAFVSLPCS